MQTDRRLIIKVGILLFFFKRERMGSGGRREGRKEGMADREGERES